MEAELLILLMAFLNPKARLYPQYFHYASYGKEFIFFIRATQHKNFLNLVEVTGIADVNKLRELVKEGHIKLGVAQWHNFIYSNDRDFRQAMNMDKLDTL